MEREKIKHIVVADDNRRFFLHVWRYLSGLPGFGIGDVSPRPRDVSRTEREHLDINTEEYRALADGSCLVWWVDTKKGEGSPYDPVEALRSVCARIIAMNGELALVLIDRHCDSADMGPEDFLRCVQGFKLEGLKVLCVSAYGTDKLSVEGRRVPVYAKTDELLQSLRKMVGLKRPTLELRRRDSVAHVLITGAGFELGKHGLGLGLPPTWDVLRYMHERFPQDLKAKVMLSTKLVGVVKAVEIKRLCSKFSVSRTGLDDGLKLPVILPKDPDLGLPTKLFDAAMSGNLDLYFTELLKLVHEMYSTKQGQLQAELAVRQAFREVLLEHDWGLMQQSVDAAALPWAAWISTNYTGFADRAIRDASARVHEVPGLLPWFIVSTAAEAEVAYALKLEHALSSTQGLPDPRYLFKVHGDIGDVRTMALAGEDKNVLSNVKVLVASLYKLYAAAQQTLARLLAGKSVVFHIVGHGLQDTLLNGLLKQAPCSRGGRTFILVDPQAHKNEGRLITHLRNSCACEGDSIRPLVMTAAEYLPRLRRFWDRVAYDRSGMELAVRMSDSMAGCGDEAWKVKQVMADNCVKEL